MNYENYQTETGNIQAVILILTKKTKMNQISDYP